MTVMPLAADIPERLRRPRCAAVQCVCCSPPHGLPCILTCTGRCRGLLRCFDTAELNWVWVCRRDYLLKVQDIDNIAKRMHAYPPPANGAAVMHPASLGANGAAAAPPPQQQVRLCNHDQLTVDDCCCCC